MAGQQQWEPVILGYTMYTYTTLLLDDKSYHIGGQTPLISQAN